jgi:hypothetical protein
MRKFQVGDKVKWYEIDDCPMWDFNELYARVKKGEWAEGFVTRVDADNTFLVDGWQWPQPGHELARYGVPGYLELVEAIPEKMFRVVDTLDARSIYIEDGECVALSVFPESCRPEIQAICTKLNKEHGKKGAQP